MNTTPKAPEGFKPFNDYFEYRIAGQFVYALIYDDFSGLDDDEVNLLDDWHDSTRQNSFSNVFDVVDDESSFAICEVCDLFDDCYTVRQHFYNPKLDEVAA